ncbi:myb dna-binding domain protein [Diplodia corticola]|uniref:Myb dna-binding domain protein n=1 Tax=Diplodia corticola TaxID=236234 RepID=A0A1J9QKD5_9PEZI|nr:myb dna-binding domain protein [Diplodia corticola]OJD28937.1 myb dna-binding domain protein [Diplodia corticola]
MAQSRRVRSRATPQPDVDLSHQQQSTRITRSQSRDPDILPTQHGTNPSRRNGRGASAESIDSVDTDTVRARATRSSRRAVERTLPVVEEDAAVQYPALPQPVEAVPDDDEADSPLYVENDYIAHQPPRAQSNVSGTTAISTAQTVHDPADLDNDLMIEFLEDLYTGASKILTIIAPKSASTERLASVASEAADADSRTRRLLEKRAKHFREARGNFGDGDFINVETVLASLAHGEAMHEPDVHRLDAILYMANVAALASQIATLPEDRSAMFHSLLLLDHTFPRNLIGSLELEDGALGEETFNLALDIRTQFAISLLMNARNEVDFDPDASLNSVFFAIPDDEDGEGSGASHLRGWDILGLGSGDDDLPKPIKEAVTKRIDKIRGAFREDQEALQQRDYIDAETLELDFPWHGFVIGVLEWASVCSVEFENEVGGVRGIHEIQESLQQYLEAEDTQYSGERKQIASQSQGESTAETESQSQQIPGTNQNVARHWKKRWDRFKGQGIEVAEDPREASAPNGAVPQTAEEDYQPPITEEEDDSRTSTNPPAGSSIMQEDLESLRLREKQNKENMRRTMTNSSPSARKSFYDKQKSATRVSWDEPEVSFPTEFASSSKRPKRRRRVETESDEEEEFETRISNNKRKAPVKRRTRYDSSSIPPPSPSARGETSRRAVRTRLEEGEDYDGRDEVPPSPAEQFKTVNQQAKAVSGTYGIRVGKGRRPWSREEVNVLMELVATFKNSAQPWAMIKSTDSACDDVLRHRSNKDLKDKAINMIYNYRLAGQALPTGFEVFRLPAKLQEKVEKRRGVLPEDSEE